MPRDPDAEELARQESENPRCQQRDDKWGWVKIFAEELKENVLLAHIKEWMDFGKCVNYEPMHIDPYTPFGMGRWPWLQPAEPRKGRFTWNFTSSKPTPPIRREDGHQPVMKLSPNIKYFQEWMNHQPHREGVKSWAGTWTPPTEAFSILCQFLSNRPWTGVQLHNRDRWWACPPKYFKEELGFAPGHYSQLDCGHWIQWRCRDYVHVSELGVDDALGYHATSMYCLGKIMHDGQCRTGFAENTQGNKTMKGVFYMLPAQVQCCDNYMHYVTLDDNGWLYGVLLQLRVRRESYDPEGRGQTLRRKQNQRLTYEGRHSLNSVFFT